MKYILEITTTSDATFGSGEGVAGLIDSEVEYDPETGLPFLGARTLRGLLVEECANLLYALQHANPTQFSAARDAARRLFGEPGSREQDAGALFVSKAELPEKLRCAMQYAVHYGQVKPREVLEALTTLRRQTALDSDGGVAKNSLRAQRAILRDTTFQAILTLPNGPVGMEEALLSACARCVRRAGMGRNRGRGALQARLYKQQGGTRIEILPDALLGVAQ